jgi:hypothetical protein
MISGIQEILVLVVIILGIIFLPRILNRGQEKKPLSSKPAFELSGKIRIAIAGSIIWLAVIAAWMQPWKKDPYNALYLGLGPVATIWLIHWVVSGFRKK